MGSTSALSGLFKCPVPSTSQNLRSAPMPRVPFDQLPSASRLWVFPAERSLSDDEESTLLGRADEFLETWAAHGVPLRCGRDWRRGRFLLVAVDEASEPPSGCSIDAMTNLLKDVGRDLGISLADHGPVYFLQGQEVRSVTRGEFQQLVDAGEVDLETVVFDNTITRVAEMEEAGWEKPAGASWHRRAFFPGQ